MQSARQPLFAFAARLLLLLPLIPGFLFVAPVFLLTLVDAIHIPRPWFRTYFYYVHLPLLILAYVFQLVTVAALSRRKPWARIATAYCFRIYMVVLSLVTTFFLTGAAVLAARGESTGSITLVIQAAGSILGAVLVAWISRRMASKEYPGVA
jgi:hypothetical protein